VGSFSYAPGQFTKHNGQQLRGGIVQRHFSELELNTQDDALSAADNAAGECRVLSPAVSGDDNSDITSTGSSAGADGGVTVAGRRRDIRPSCCQSRSHLKIRLLPTLLSRAIWATLAPGRDAN